MRNARLTKQIRNAGQLGGIGAGLGDVVQGRQRMRFAAAELGDEGEHRGGVLRSSRQPPQHHAGMFIERPREAGAGEELGRIPVVFGRGAGHHLL